jgi:hypothetical protein
MVWAPFIVEKIGLEILGIVRYTRLKSEEFIVDTHLVALNEALTVIELLTLLGISDKVLSVYLIFVDVKCTDLRHGNLVEVLKKVNHKRPVVLFLFEHLEDELG